MWVEHNHWQFPLFDLSVVKPPKREERLDDDHRDYQTKVNLGDEIGMGVYSLSADGQKQTPGLGTLGCYIEVKRRGRWFTLALTNYHVVRPLLDGFELTSGDDPAPSNVAGQDTALYKADLEGITTEQGRQLDTIEHPSRKTHLRIMHILQGDIDEAKSQKRKKESKNLKRLEKEYQEKKDFFDKEQHKFDRLWAVSGFSRRSAAVHRLDWALIEPTADRIGTNSLPKLNDWIRWKRPKHSDDPDTHSHLRDPSPRATRDQTEQATIMFKMGTTSGLTAARYSMCKGAVGIRKARYLTEAKEKTEEHFFVPCQRRGADDEVNLASKGDSGSVVYNDEGKVVGLLFRGTAP